MTVITNEMYEDFKNMIYKKAISFSKTTSVPVEELVSQGNETFCKCMATHDADRGLFSTYLYLSLETSMIGFCNKWRLWSAVGRHVSHHKVPIKLDRRKGSKHGRTVVYSTVRTEDIVYIDSDAYDSDAHKIGSSDLTLRRLMYNDWLKSLSSDARTIAELVTSTFDAAEAKRLGANGSTIARIIRSSVRRKLRRSGWTQHRTRNSLQELKRRVAEL